MSLSCDRYVIGGIMKCPACKKDNFKRESHDQEILGCEDCHHIASFTHASGFWIGYIEAENKYKKQLQALYDASRNVVNSENIYIGDNRDLLNLVKIVEQTQKVLGN